MLRGHGLAQHMCYDLSFVGVEFVVEQLREGPDGGEAWKYVCVDNKLLR